MARGMLTREEGPVVIGPRSMAALMAIRRAKLLPRVYAGPFLMVRDAVGPLAEEAGEPPAWVRVHADPSETALPERLAGIDPVEAATLRLALAEGASRVLLEEPVKERAKLSFIRAEGVVSFLVHAYRLGELTAVGPMMKALAALGHERVLPPPEQLEALAEALDNL